MIVPELEHITDVEETLEKIAPALDYYEHCSIDPKENDAEYRQYYRENLQKKVKAAKNLVAEALKLVRDLCEDAGY